MNLSTHTAIAIGLGIYACMMLGMSAYWMTRIKKSADYLVAGRGLPFWVVTGTVTAGSIGTGCVIGAPGLAYLHGWAGSAYPIGLGLGTVIVGLLFARTRRFRFMTLGEEIACYYGGNRIVAEFSNLSLFLSQLGWLTVQIIGCGSVLSAVTGLRLRLCIVLAGLIMAAISIPGGFKTVAYTDFLNAGILVGGFTALTVSALHHADGLTGLRHAVPPPYFSVLGVASYGHWAIATLMLTLVFSVVADPGRRLAMYSARKETSARWGTALAGTVVMVFSVSIGIAGMYAFRLNPHLASPDEALPWIVVSVLPAWLAGVVVVSMTAAILSCANANAAAVGTFFVRHIYPLATRGNYPRRPVAVVRLILVCAFVASTTLALHAGTIVSFVMKFLPITMSGLAIIILVAHFWSRATWQGAVAGLAVTPAISIAGLFVRVGPDAWTNPTVLAAAAGTLALIGVSLATKRENLTFEEVAARLARERDAVEGEPHGGVQHAETTAQPLEVRRK